MTNIDYSKWDRLELSDDSDIEVHPNIDKRSFINWKRRDIHEKREMNKIRMKNLEDTVVMNENLQRMIQDFAANLEKVDDIEEYSKKWILNNPNNQRASDDGPTYTEMIRALISKIFESTSNEFGSDKKLKFIAEARKHGKTLQEQIDAARKELAELSQSMHQKITSEDIHTGFDSSFISEKKATKKSFETIHPGRIVQDADPKIGSAHITDEQDSAQKVFKKDNLGEELDLEDTNDDDVDKSLSPEAEEFSKIEIGNYDQCLKFLGENSWMISSDSTVDALLLVAFNWQMKGQEKMAKQCVHQGLLLQYCHQLGKDGVSLFFDRIVKNQNNATKVFLDDVNSTYSRIKKRSAELSSESASIPVEQIQLVATDPSTKIKINLPMPEDLEARAVFESFPPKFRKALESGNLDEINKVLGAMPVDEAEIIVEKLSQANMLNLEQGIIDATKEDVDVSFLSKASTNMEDD